MPVEVLRTAILDFCRRRKNRTFCPSEVVRQLFPQDWELFMPDIHKEMMQMYREGLIKVTQKGIPIDPSQDPRGQVRISGLAKPK
jgi:hypothetical protein